MHVNTRDLHLTSAECKSIRLALHLAIAYETALIDANTPMFDTLEPTAEEAQTIATARRNIEAFKKLGERFTVKPDRPC